MPDNIRTIIVSEEEAGTRLDLFLAESDELALSRNRVQKLIESGLVKLNGQTPNKKQLVVIGDQIIVEYAPASVINLEPENIALEIIYEDNYLAVVNKPAGLVTHPGAGNFSGTLVNALLYHFKNLATGSSAERPGIVHRLDRDTSGLLLVAKQDEISTALQKDLADRKVKRRYLALVWGHMLEEKGTIDLPIGRSTRDRRKMAIVSDGGREAVTHYELLKRYRSFDLLEVSLETGRTHQIRVHLANLSHPVFGDPDYGGRNKMMRGLFAPERPLAKEMLAVLERQALLAYQISFDHPQTGQKMEFEIKPPDDLQAVIDLLDSEGS